MSEENLIKEGYQMDDKKFVKQEYQIDKNEDFELKHIFDCGQCFRWNVQDDGSYIGVIRSGVLKVSEQKGKIIFEGMLNSKIDEVVKEYFDLERSYSSIKGKLCKIDDNMKKSIEYGHGIRILNQDLWETIISFIISANNNIPRIKGIIEKMSKRYGSKIIFEDKEYFLFPTKEQLKNVSVEDFRALGVGFRDIRLYETTQMINSKEVDLERIYEASTAKAREQLSRLSGVGPKVADCILLFSDLKRFDIFPIDVWVRRVMNDLYIHNSDEKKVSKKLIYEIAYKKFGDLEGIAQQYLFYWRRDSAQ